MSATDSHDCCHGAMLHFSIHWSQVDETDFSENLLLAPDRRHHPPRKKKQTTKHPTEKKSINLSDVKIEQDTCGQSETDAAASQAVVSVQFSSSVDVSPPILVGRC